MKVLSRLSAGAAVAATIATTSIAGLALTGGPAAASPLYRSAPGSSQAVFVQSDNTSANTVVAYRRGRGGELIEQATYATGGQGGQLAGSQVDHLASQGSLTYDAPDSLLFAVNAGSDTVSVFAVNGDRLALRQVIGSGGTFPVSVAARGRTVFVLNAENGGSVQGYAEQFGRLTPIPGTNRRLGLDPSATPQFTNTPGQVAFSPDGSQLLVTTKANGNDIDVFAVGRFGQLSPSPVVNSEPGTVPFGVSFDARGNLVVAEAGTNALATFQLRRDGHLVALDAVATGQAATCWVAPARGYFYASNAGSATVSGFRASFGGQLDLLGATATAGGTVDASSTPGGQYLYVQTGAAGIVDGYRVAEGGALTPVGSVTVPGAIGGEGIVAT